MHEFTWISHLGNCHEVQSKDSLYESCHHSFSEKLWMLRLSQKTTIQQKLLWRLQSSCETGSRTSSRTGSRTSPTTTFTVSRRIHDRASRWFWIIDKKSQIQSLQILCTFLIMFESVVGKMKRGQIFVKKTRGTWLYSIETTLIQKHILGWNKFLILT